MGHPAGRKEESRARILDAAGQGFRARGYAGLGVDGLAKAAGVTSGAFYAHFPSKAAAFEAALVRGLAELRDGVLRFRSELGDDWVGAFIDFSLSDRRTGPLAESCALQTLSGEVARAEPAARQAYEGELAQVIDAIADGLPGDSVEDRRARATALLALLSGGVTLARAVDGAETSDAIAQALAPVARAIAIG